MSACGPRDPGVDTLSSAGGSALPFLPTVATAIIVACASLLCRAPSTTTEPTPPAPIAQASMAGSDGFHPALPGSETLTVVPAALAFARLHPLTLQVAEAGETARAAPVRPARPATASRRPCSASRCTETRRTDTAARAAPAPVKAASEPAAVPAPMRGQPESDEGFLPAGALPFAATAASWVDDARRIGGSVGNGAASLGGSVVELLASAR